MNKIIPIESFFDIWIKLSVEGSFSYCKILYDDTMYSEVLQYNLEGKQINRFKGVPEHDSMDSINRIIWYYKNHLETEEVSFTILTNKPIKEIT